MKPIQFSAALPEVDVIPYTVVDPRLVEPVAVHVLDGATSYLNVAIGMHSGWRPLRVDVHLPASGDGPFPVVVYAHGGAFVGGVKEMGPWGSLPGRGIAVVSVEYRLAGEARYPETVEDIVTAIRWVRAHAGDYRLDPERVAGWGSSAGGYLMGRAAVSAGMTAGRQLPELAGYSAALSAVVLHYAASDLSEIVALAKSDPALKDRVGPNIDLIYGRNLDSDDLSAVIEHGSVLRAVSAAAQLPAFLLAHGGADRTVPVEQSIRLRDAVRARGGYCELTVVPGEDHATAVFAEPEIVDPTIEFLFAVWAGQLPPTTDGAQP
ncbi:alpha/beta hydrolase fold domain-containing protein [Phytohabitans kaempferiae]|uniref:Alpha/beta hydrolase fold domain-containing protein n=1 Tax=Phytohabitans kaempferiae TaxID=1620943 RepID=A0ABV6MAP5_9ACTN